MRRLVAAAALVAISAAAQGTAAQGTAAQETAARETAAKARWGPVSEKVGIGSAICADHETVVCAVVLCRDGALSLGLIGTDPEGAEQPVEVAIEIDGETYRREMTGVPINDGVVHLGTPVSSDDPLWARMRAGNTVRIADRAEAEAREFSLRGSAVELDRVAATCR